MDFDYVYESEKSPEELLNSLETALKERKYGIMSNISVKNVMTEKGVPFDREIFLVGICNPHHAKKALETEERVALFLPCSAVIYQTENGSRLRLAKPTMITGFFDNEELLPLGREVEADLVAAVESAVNS